MLLLLLLLLLLLHAVPARVALFACYPKAVSQKATQTRWDLAKIKNVPKTLPERLRGRRERPGSAWSEVRRLPAGSEKLPPAPKSSPGGSEELPEVPPGIHLGENSGVFSYSNTIIFEVPGERHQWTPSTVPGDW